eukprot:357855-Chlamydomonas_euryale.AAC.3
MGAHAFKRRNLKGLAGLKAARQSTHPQASASKAPNIATQVTAVVGGGGRGRGEHHVWKCNGIFKKLTKVCGLKRKGGQTKLLAHCLARYKPPGGHDGWPISHGLCCMGSLNCVLVCAGGCCSVFCVVYDVGMIFLHAQRSAPASATVHPAEGAPFTVQSNPGQEAAWSG